MRETETLVGLVIEKEKKFHRQDCSENCKENFVSPKSHYGITPLTFLEILLGGFGSIGVSLASPELRLFENFFRFRFSAANAPKCK